MARFFCRLRAESGCSDSEAKSDPSSDERALATTWRLAASRSSPRRASSASSPSRFTCSTMRVNCTALRFRLAGFAPEAGRAARLGGGAGGGAGGADGVGMGAMGGGAGSAAGWAEGWAAAGWAAAGWAAGSSSSSDSVSQSASSKDTGTAGAAGAGATAGCGAIAGGVTAAAGGGRAAGDHMGTPVGVTLAMASIRDGNSRGPVVTLGGWAGPLTGAARAVGGGGVGSGASDWREGRGWGGGGG